MDFLTSKISNFLNFLNLDIVFFTALALQALCGAAYAAAKKGSVSGIKNLFKAAAAINVTAFMLSCFPSENTGQPAALFIMLCVSGGVILSAAHYAKMRFIKNTAVPFTACKAEPAAEQEEKEIYRDSKFENYIADIKEKIKYGEKLEQLALSISAARDSGNYTEGQKKVLNEQLCSAIKTLSDK